MPNIKLSETKCRREFLQDLCMFCWETATDRKEKKFSWNPGWVWVFVLFGVVGIVVALILASVLSKKMVVKVPICDRHTGYWKRRGIVLVGSFCLVSAFAIGALVILSDQGPGNDELTGWLCGSGVVLFFIWLVGAAIYSARGVRPTEITDRYIFLSGVHRDFVRALEKDRDRDHEEEQEYR